MKNFSCVLVEDIPENAKDLIEKLQKHCPNVDVICTAKTCKEAVAFIDFHKPNLLFLDIELPDGDGFNVLEQIKDKALPVIFTTGFMEFEYMKKAVDLSAVDYLNKPINPDKLVQAVKRAAELRSPQELQKQHQVLVDMASDPTLEPTEIILHSEGKLYFINPRDIIHANSVKGLEKTIVYYRSEDKEDNIVCSCLLKTMADKLKPLPYLFRTSKTDIVNLHKIKIFDKSVSTLSLKGCDAHEAFVGEAYENEFFERLKKLGILM